MAVHSVPRSPIYKRPAEFGLDDSSSQKSPRTEEKELPLLFQSIQAALIACEENNDPVTSSVELLSQSHEALAPFQQIPLKKIREAFKERFAPLEEFKLNEKAINKVLQALYPISLRNSRIHELIVTTNRQLPELKAMLARPVKDEIHHLLRNARALLRKEEEPAILPQISEMMGQLNLYRVLKEHLNREETQRVLDLAEALRVAHAPTTYPLILSDYPEIVKQIKELESELKTVSEMVKELNDLKLKLQKKHAVKIVEHPLETRFLNAFGQPLYQAFAMHGWDLLWNSVQAGEVQWKTASSREILDFTAFNQFWAEYFPDFELSDWILLALLSKNDAELDELESKLQPWQKIINGIQTTPTLKNKRETCLPYEKEMLSICLKSFQPPLKTMLELKAFLAGRIRK